MKTVKIVLTIVVALGINSAFANANKNCPYQADLNIHDNPSKNQRITASVLGNDTQKEKRTRRSTRSTGVSR